MSQEPKTDGLELNHDVPFQRADWRAQRIGWVVLFLIVLAALAGLLGKGPLSDVSAASPQGQIQVEYDRFLHYRDPTSLQIHLKPPADADNELRVAFDHSYLHGFEIQRITPEPREELAGETEHVFVFEADDVRRSTWIVLHLDPDEFGTIEGSLRVGDESILIRHFIYP